MTELIEVLIVEDDKRIAEIHKRFTEKVDGFHVIATATTGEEAKEWLEVVKPQLVLLDVYLPDMKGTELVQFIRTHFFEMDIIMITAASETHIVRQAMQGGVFDYIVKPLTLDQFKDSLEKYKKYIEEISQNEEFTPEQISVLWKRDQKVEVDEIIDKHAPKGIDPLTLKKVLESINDLDSDGITAGVFSKRVGMSPSTARRYLEYLISQKLITAELIYGTVGRPERKYFKRNS